MRCLETMIIGHSTESLSVTSGITRRERWLLQAEVAKYPPMCNLYSLNKKRDTVARFFRVSHNRAAAFAPVSAIFPKQVAPVVRTAADGEREIVAMSWGF